MTSSNGGTGNAATASLTVVAPPTITKSFGAATIPLNGSTNLQFNITNPNSTVALTGIGFTDTLPAGLVVATLNGLSSTCGGGTVTALSGSNSISLSGATLAGGAGCTVLVNVTGTTAGVWSNSVTVSSIEGGTGNKSTSSLTVVAPPVLAKSFTPPVVALNGASTLSFTVTNPNGTVSLTGVAFTDTLPAGVVVAAPGFSGPAAGGTLTAVSGSSSISLSGATLDPSSVLVPNIEVTGATAGVKNNAVTVTSTNGGTGNTATATLTVAAPPVIVKSFGAPTIPLNGIGTSLQFTISNPNTTVALSGIGFTDNLPPGLTTPDSGPVSLCGGTFSTSSNTITLSGAMLTGGASCTFSVNVTGTSAGVKTNTTSTVSSNEAGPGAPATATITVVAPPVISKSFGAAAIAPGDTTSLSFTSSTPTARSR